MIPKRFLTLLAVGVTFAPVATAAPSGATAQPSTVGPNRAPESQRMEKARALSELMTPFDLMVGSNMRAWEAGVQAAIAADPSTRKLEAAYPGIIKASIDAARPVGRRFCEAYVRKLLEHKASLIVAQLSLAEMDEATGMYARPAWRRFVTRLMSNVKMGRVADDAAASVRETGKPGLTEDGVRATLNAAARTAGEQTPGEDQIDLLRLSRTAFFPKIKAIGAASDRQSLEWANNPDPAAVAEQKEAMQRGVLAFVDARKK